MEYITCSLKCTAAPMNELPEAVALQAKDQGRCIQTPPSNRKQHVITRLGDGVEHGEQIYVR